MRHHENYYPQDDILEIRLSDKSVAREVSQDWNVNVSYAEDGSVVELVILDAVKTGFMPFQGGGRCALCPYTNNVIPALAAALSNVITTVHPAAAAMRSTRQSAKSALLDSNRRKAFQAISAP